MEDDELSNMDYEDLLYLRRMDNSTECLDMNSELWLFRQDYTTLPLTMAFFAVLYFTIIVAGVTGNICVILAISRTKSLQTVPNMFIFSLSCSDLVVCSLSATITPITAFKKEWLFGGALCTVAPWIAGISLCFSTFTLTAISIDRYILIKYPMKKPLSKNQALFIIAGIVVAAAVICSPTAMKQKLVPFENFCGEYCTEEWNNDVHGRRLYGALLLTVQFVIPLTIIIISYSAISLRIGQSMILKSTKRNGSPTGDWKEQLTDQQRLALKRRQRTNRMLIGMVVAFSASWIWSVAYNLCRDYEMLPDAIVSQEYLFGIGTHCIAMTSTVWNPLLYALLNLQLRAAFINLMPDKLRHFIGVEMDEKTSPLANGASEHPYKNGSLKLNRPPATTAICTNEAITRPKYGATAQTVLYNTAAGSGTGGTGSCNGNSSSGASRASVRGRKPSAIRVIVSRLSASIASMTDTADQEDELHLLEATSSSSSDDADHQRAGAASQLAIPDDVAPRRGSASSVRVQRALFSLHLPHLTRVNSF